MFQYTYISARAENFEGFLSQFLLILNIPAVAFTAWTQKLMCSPIFDHFQK